MRRISKTGRLLALVAVVALLTLLYFNGHKKVATIIPSSNQTSGSGVSNQKSPAPGQQTPSPSSTSSPRTSTQSTPTTVLAGSITAPFGEFVSNHSPNLSNTMLSQEYSICNTTPGASCFIKFTKDNITRQLAAKITDSSGSTSWQWDIHDANLTTGEWSITAVASSTTETKSTPDKISLNIRP